MLLLSLLCFTDIDEDIEHAKHDSAETIVSIPDLDEDIGQFVKGVVLMLCDKFVKDELLNTKIANLVGGNMKIIEDYVQRRGQKFAEELIEENIVNMSKKCFEIDEIILALDVSKDFVVKTLAKL